MGLSLLCILKWHRVVVGEEEGVVVVEQRGRYVWKGWQSVVCMCHGPPPFKGTQRWGE